jgi:hypothetical protein
MSERPSLSIRNIDTNLLLLLLLLLLRCVRKTFAQYQEYRNQPAAVVVAAAASHPLAKTRLTRSKLRTAELTRRSS